MGKVSLQWRLALFMGGLVCLACLLLTALSIRSANETFIRPLVPDQPRNLAGESAQSFDAAPGSLPEGTIYLESVSMDPLRARRAFSLTSLLCLVLVTGGSMAVAYWLAGRALRPIRELDQQIRKIDGKSLSQRVTVPETGDELQHLSCSFNQLLERLEREFQREKRFSDDMAHELKTPLANLIASAQLLQMDEHPTAEDYAEQLEITLHSGKRLAGVVEGMLALHRADQGFETGPVALEPLLADLRRDLEQNYREKELYFQWDVTPAEVTGSASLLRQALGNLLDNAYKYTPAGGSISVSIRLEDRYLVLRISDNGPGIPPEDLDHIFEPFYRADKSRSSKVPGIGLGLALTQDICMLHGAFLSVESTPGKGSCFIVRFERFIGKETV